jgi:hypothetical protein
MKEQIEIFETVKLALARIDLLHNEKIVGFLNCSPRKDSTYEWRVRFTPKDKRKKK